MSVYLFSRSGLRELAPYLGSNTLLAFDFDGTLVPIVQDPLKAAFSKKSKRLLERLSQNYSVALVSGRSLADLKPRSPFPLLAWVGNHGAEGFRGFAKVNREAAAIVSRWEKILRPALERYPDVWLENKKYSLTLHYRFAKNRSSRKKILVKLSSSLSPLPQLIPGKCVLNLIAPGQRNKGSAVQALLQKHKFKKAIFVGDDDTDEDVFRLLDPRIFSVRVGNSRKSMANAYLKNQGEMEVFLSLLLAAPSNPA